MSVEYATTLAESDSPVPTLVCSVQPVSAMSLSELAQHCKEEMRNYCQGKVGDDCYALEIFRRAMRLHDAQAWDVLHQCFSGMVCTWLRRHSKRERAYALDSEENYIAQAFTRLWQASMNNTELTFTSVAAALNYLRASLNGAIMDTLRSYTHANEVPLPEDNDTLYNGEPITEEPEDPNEVWHVVRSLLSDPREIRLAYLYFHCGLKAREIVHFCPLEFAEVQEVYRLRHNIFKRLTRNAAQIRWRLSCL